MKAHERLIQYVKFHTTSSEESHTHPSFDKEWDFAKALAGELKELGLSNVRVDAHCYVYGFLPATQGCEEAPCIGLIAHMDTSPDASGENVNPILHPGYDGEDLILSKETGVLLCVKRFPFLKNLKGETLITSDGTTLLGADDKAGIAEIMTVLEELISDNLPHGPISVAFTPDEEIGEGADFFDVQGFGADFAYTVDGGDVNCLEYENFNAASAKIIIHGISVHPGDAKDKMRNAINVAMELHSLLPEKMRPEHTEGYEGFFHLHDFTGDVTTAVLSYLVRDHSKELFEEKKNLIQSAVKEINRRYGEDTAELVLTDSYYNMREMIAPHMHLVDTARDAILKNNMTPIDVPIRGGTDGARLSFEGLPCPNLGTGGFNYHGVFECITIERMDLACAVIRDIISAYSERIRRNEH